MVTRHERGKIIELHAKGKGYRQIANEVGISKDGARKIVFYWTNTGELNPPPRLGRKPARNKRDRRPLVCLSDLHPRATITEIAQEAGLNIKPRKIEKYLHQEHRLLFLARCKPWLGRESRKRRRRWCRERRNSKKQDFRQLVYRDDVTCSWVSRDSQREIRRYWKDREEKRRWKSLQEI